MVKKYVLTTTLLFGGFFMGSLAMAQDGGVAPAADVAAPTVPDLEAAPTSAPTPVAEPPTIEEASGLLLSWLKQVKEGGWARQVVALLAIVMTLALRIKWVTDKIKWFGTNRGGFVLVSAVAVSGAVVHAFAAGGVDAIDRDLFYAALQVLGQAVLGYVGAKKLLGSDEASVR